MLYTEKEKTEIERVRKVFAEHLQQSTNFELLWSDKVGFVWLAIGLNPLYATTCKTSVKNNKNRIKQGIKIQGILEYRLFWTDINL